RSWLVSAVELRLGKISASLTQDLVGLTEPAVLSLQGLELGGHVRGQARLAPAVSLGPANPLMQRLRRAADLRGNRSHRRPPRGMILLVLENQPNRARAHFRRKSVRCLACHRSTFSRLGASGKPGAVHFRRNRLVREVVGAIGLMRSVTGLSFVVQFKIMTPPRQSVGFQTGKTTAALADFLVGDAGIEPATLPVCRANDTRVSSRHSARLTHESEVDTSGRREAPLADEFLSRPRFFDCSRGPGRIRGGEPWHSAGPSFAIATTAAVAQLLDVHVTPK